MNSSIGLKLWSALGLATVSQYKCGYKNETHSTNDKFAAFLIFLHLTAVITSEGSTSLIKTSIAAL